MAKTKKTTVDKDEATVVNGPTVKVKGKLKHGPDEPAPTPTPEPVKVVVKDDKIVEVKVKSSISKNMLETLQAMKGGKPMTHTQIAAITKREKGNKLRELTAAGLVTTGDQEGVRGFVYTITKLGLKALNPAK